MDLKKILSLLLFVIFVSISVVAFSDTEAPAADQDLEFAVGETHIQYRNDASDDWEDLISLDALKNALDIDANNSEREVEFQATETYIQWKYVDETNWNNLLDLSTIAGIDGLDGSNGTDGTNGTDGREVEFRETATNLEWRYVGEDDTAWRALLDLITLAGTNGLDGDDGREVEFNTTATHIQWRYVGETNWIDLLDLSTLPGGTGEDGTDGREVELQASATHIQWKYVDETTWNDLIALTLLTGTDGADGTNGTDGSDGADGREVEFRENATNLEWRYVGEDDTAWRMLLDLTTLAGADGSNGTDGADGREIELRLNTTHLEYRYVGEDDTAWQQLIPISLLTGPEGPQGEQGISVNLQGTLALIADLDDVVNPQTGDAWIVTESNGGDLFFRTAAGTWDNIGKIVGPEGPAGKNVVFQTSATHIEWKYVGDTTWNQLYALADLEGQDGKNVSFQVANGYIQYQYDGDTTWTDLVDLTTLAGANGADGADGREVELQVSATHIQWKYTDDTTWTDLVALTSLTGAAGADGTNGTDGTDGTDGREVEFNNSLTHIQWRYVGETVWNNLVDLSTLAGTNGTDGREVEFNTTATHIQWRYVGETTWIDLLDLSTLPSGSGEAGTDGREVELQASATHIQWKYSDETVWKDLIALTAITGAAGADGTNGTDGINGTDGREVEFNTTATHIQWRYVGETTWNDLVDLSSISGTDGREVEFTTSATHIQWRYAGETTWNDLVALSALTGTAGTDGTDGINGVDGREVEFRENGTNLEWRYVGEDDTAWQVAFDLSSLSTGGGTTETRDYTGIIADVTGNISNDTLILMTDGPNISIYSYRLGFLTQYLIPFANLKTNYTGYFDEFTTEVRVNNGLFEWRVEDWENGGKTDWIVYEDTSTGTQYGPDPDFSTRTVNLNVFWRYDGEIEIYNRFLIAANDIKALNLDDIVDANDLLVRKTETGFEWNLNSLLQADATTPWTALESKTSDAPLLLADLDLSEIMVSYVGEVTLNNTNLQSILSDRFGLDQAQFENFVNNNSEYLFVLYSNGEFELFYPGETTAYVVYQNVLPMDTFVREIDLITFDVIRDDWSDLRIDLIDIFGGFRANQIMNELIFTDPMMGDFAEDPYITYTSPQLLTVLSDGSYFLSPVAGGGGETTPTEDVKVVFAEVIQAQNYTQAAEFNVVLNSITEYTEDERAPIRTEFSSNFPYSSPVMLVALSDGTYWLTSFGQGAQGNDGTDGREVEFNVTDTAIEWRYVGETTWTNLIDLSELTGADGTNGTDGNDGETIVVANSEAELLTYVDFVNNGGNIDHILLSSNIVISDVFDPTNFFYDKYYDADSNLLIFDFTAFNIVGQYSFNATLPAVEIISDTEEVDLMVVTETEITETLFPESGKTPLSTITNSQWSANVTWKVGEDVVSPLTEFLPNVIYTAVLDITTNRGFVIDNALNPFTDPASESISFDDTTQELTITYPKIEALQIIYNLDGGVNAEANPDFVLETTTLLDPVRTGYNFAGWYDNPGFTGDVLTTIAGGQIGELQVYAKWEAQIYSISYLTSDSTVTENDILYSGTGNIQMFAGVNHAAALMPTGSLLMWGGRNQGQIGEPNSSLGRKEPRDVTPDLNLASGETIDSVSLGDGFTIVLTSNGRVLTFGSQVDGRLGNGQSSGSTYIPQDITSEFSLDAGDKIVHIAAGYTHAGAVTENGKVFIWGSDGLSTNYVPAEGYATYVNSGINFHLDSDDKVIMLSMGYKTTGILSSKGIVMVRGLRRNFALGDNASSESQTGSVDFPVVLNNYFTGLSGTDKIISIHMSPQNGFVLSQEGQVYSWGRNAQHGLAGITQNDPFVNPHKIPIRVDDRFGLSPGETITSLHVGWGNSQDPSANVSTFALWAHFGAITSNNRVLVWGNNSNGQLGTGTADNSQDPKLSDITNQFNGEIVTDLAFNGLFSLTSTNAGYVYVYGENQSEIFGIEGVDRPSSSPVPIINSTPKIVYVQEVTTDQYQFGATIALPTPPTRVGYTFGGWFYADNSSVEFTETTMPSSNVTLIAKWIPDPV